MNYSEFKKQISNYLNDSISQQELRELLKHLRSDRGARRLRRVLRSNVMRDGFTGVTYNQMAEKSFEKLIEKIEKIENGRSVEIKHDFLWDKRRLLRLSGVAAIIIVVITLGGIWFSGESGLLSPWVAQINDLAPGGSKAVLTLSDESKIILDSVANGVIATEENVTIIKTSDGRINYVTTGRSKSRHHYNTVTTPLGGEYQLTLPDSTIVWLNSESAIRLPLYFADNQRRVEIVGEAYFEVKSDATKPFHVVVGDLEIEVLGTSFNIRAYADENKIETTLVEGSLKIISGNTENLIQPGQRAVSELTGDLTIYDNAEIESIIAWKNGLFIFNSSSIEEIMFQISKWYNVEIVYSGKITSDTFSGRINRNSPVSGVLAIMEEAGIEFKIYENKIVVGR